jgi:hypothetical protein
MSLLDAAAQSAGIGSGPVGTAVKEEAAVSKGASYQRKQKEKLYQAGVTIQGALKRGNVQLSPAEKEAIELLTRKPGTASPRAASAKPIIYKIFGDTLQVGAKKTALDVFDITQKGYNELKQILKKWDEKHGAKVEYNPEAKTYVLTNLGDLPAKFEATA